MSNQFEFRYVADAPPLELRVAEDGRRMFRGAFSVFNSRSGDLWGFKEEIRPGAFKRIITNPQQRSGVQAWFNHNPDNLLATVRAGTLRIWEDERAAWYEFPFDENDPDHMRVAAKAERGDLVGSSFGFRAAKDEWTTDEDDYPLRIVTEVAELRDVGPVSMPAYPETETTGALSFRSLSEMTGTPPEDLLAAAEKGELRAFLLDSASREPAQEEKAADAQKAADALANERTSRPPTPLPPKMPRTWYSKYQGGTSHG